MHAFVIHAQCKSLLTAQTSEVHHICLQDFLENDYGDKTVSPFVKMQTLKLVLECLIHLCSTWLDPDLFRQVIFVVLLRCCVPVILYVSSPKPHEEIRLNFIWLITHVH
jgi:hypothetical protein